MISSLKIAAKTYSVVEKPSHEMISNSAGMCSHHSQEIIIKNSQHIEQKHDTIIHEALHALDYAFQTEMTERQIHSIATALYAFMRDNKEFIQEVIS